jgi:molecular chaperone IbpA
MFRCRWSGLKHSHNLLNRRKNMTKTLTLRSLDIPSIHKFGIGFDSMLDELMRMNATQTNNNYPPYNIVKQTEDTFYIEVATAGFSEGEISVNLDNRVLTIEGQVVRNDNATYEYLHRGISSRDFVREFTLAEHVEVVNASQKDGILKIYLERVVPEEKKPKTIAINYTK